MIELNSEVISPLQMELIESVHRGFLYQHLYAVGCLLKLVSQTTGVIAVERDEDVELLIENEIIFIQVKTRSKPLIPSDIKSALQRFNELRLHYAEVHSDKVVKFAVLANVEAGPKLSSEIADDKWPSDVSIVSPSSGEALHEIAPPAWPSIHEGIAWCVEVASHLPFSTLSPETLVWKLAARVQYASSGEDGERKDHKFSRSDLPNLFEQLVEQLQSFPDMPNDYRVLLDEPSLITSERARLIIGFSGAGKTSWAACHARHNSANTVYFDVGDLPSGALATSLSRELAARFIYGSGQGSAQLPASTGLEVLQALNNRLDLVETPIVVIDNVQRIDPEDLKRIVRVCSNVRFVLLAQPWEGQRNLEALLEISAEPILGWDSHTVAAVFSDEGAKISPQIASLFTTLTGGLPLYVKNAASLCAKQYGGDAKDFINEIDSGEHIVELAQEAILRQIISSLSGDEIQIVAVLSLVALHLSKDEINRYFAALPTTINQQNTVLRSLQRKGLLQIYANGSLKLHDAIRLPASDLLGTFSSDQLLTLQVCLRDILLESLLEKRDITRLGAWLRLLGPTGQVDTLVDLATTEFFHELGEPADLKAVLISTSEDKSIAPSLRFWTLDALAFWELQDDPHTHNPIPYIDNMEKLLSSEISGDREQLSFLMKQMILAGLEKDIKKLNKIFHKTKLLFVSDAKLSRIARYNYARALYFCEDFPEALSLAEALYAEYYDLIDLTLSQVIGASPQELMALFEGRYEEQQDNIKHLADSLNLAALCNRKIGNHPKLLAIHAAKFYQLSNSHRSEMKTAQDVADDFLDCGDPIGALQTMEQHVLPVLSYFGFEANLMDAYAQYAVILAYCGQYNRAREEMAKLEAYATELPLEYQEGFANQCKMIDQIEAGLIKIPRSTINASPFSIPQTPKKKMKVGCNEPCPCGSGKKYKKCCLT